MQDSTLHSALWFVALYFLLSHQLIPNEKGLSDAHELRESKYRQRETGHVSEQFRAISLAVHW